MPDLRTIGSAITAIPFAVYAGGLISNLAFGLAERIRPGRFRSQYPALDLLTAANSPREARVLVAEILLGLQATVAWPVAVNVGAKLTQRKTNAQFAAWAALDLSDRRYAMFGAGTIVLVAALSAGDLIWSPLATAMAVILLAGTGCRHVSYLLVGIGDRLRVSRYSPQRALALVTACDAITLLLAVSLFLTSPSGTEIHLDELKEAASGLYAFGNLPALFDQSVLNILIALIGLLFYSAVVKTLLTPSTYSRTDKDHVSVAFNCVLAGELDEARRWLGKQQQLTPEAFVTRAAIELAAGNFEEARKHGATARAMELQEDSTTETLMLLWQILVPNLAPDEDQAIGFLEYCIEQKAPEALLCLVVTNSALSRLVTAQRLADSVLEVLDREDKPIARAIIHLFVEDLDTAQEILDRASPGSEIEELLRFVYLAEIELLEQLLAEEWKPSYWDEWCTKTLPTLDELAYGVPRSWEQALAATALAALGAPLVEAVPEVGEEVMRLARRTSSEVMSDAQLERLLIAQREIQKT